MKIIHKTGTGVPLYTELDYGELSIDTSSGEMYIRTSNDDVVSFSSAYDISEVISLSTPTLSNLDTFEREYEAITYINLFSTDVASPTANSDIINVKLFGTTSMPITNPGAKAIFAGGYSTAYSNVIDSVTIFTLSDAADFGDLTVARRYATSTSNATNERGVIAGGYDYNDSYSDVIDYVTISTSGNAINFGDLKNALYGAAGVSNATNERGVFAGGYTGSYYQDFTYITISTLDDSATLGDLISAKRQISSTSNATNERGVFAGGYDGSPTNVIEYINIGTFTSSSDFGDLTVARGWQAPLTNGVLERGVFAGGYTGSYVNDIDYITISTLGNATDFGDLAISRGPAGASSGTSGRGVIAGGDDGSVYQDSIEYVTIATPNNALDFGDLTSGRYGVTGTSDA